ncbi:hypothetical protein RhiirA5_406104 [Rhizophagus irregularis]|uniref:Uncharacterized protein n=1 Tax=Rhizophagus irregularis TaxID=588596 RepID=A0A2N0S808_9GLOM|nr:hypothetical protein RhiirA5_406104 [Rhizophagus irregularis]PKC71704.1 hypothetical protein RhiirA1_453234 [Rhizophagus irregularis]
MKFDEMILDEITHDLVSEMILGELSVDYQSNYDKVINDPMYEEIKLNKKLSEELKFSETLCNQLKINTKVWENIKDNSIKVKDNIIQEQEKEIQNLQEYLKEQNKEIRKIQEENSEIQELEQYNSKFKKETSEYQYALEAATNFRLPDDDKNNSVKLKEDIIKLRHSLENYITKCKGNVEINILEVQNLLKQYGSQTDITRDQ